MTHQPIEEVRLLPRKILVFCANLDSSKRNQTWRGRTCDGSAEWIYVADGKAIGNVCSTCMKRELPDLQKVAPEQHWHVEPLYHDNPDYPDQTLDRLTGEL